MNLFTPRVKKTADDFYSNAVELIVSILALVKNQIDIVQESLIGSILSNLLLVMGMSFFLGGITRIRQHFNLTVAQTASSLLALAVGSLIIPAAFRAWAEGECKLPRLSLNATHTETPQPMPIKKPISRPYPVALPSSFWSFMAATYSSSSKPTSQSTMHLAKRSRSVAR